MIPPCELDYILPRAQQHIEYALQAVGCNLVRIDWSINYVEEYVDGEGEVVPECFMVIGVAPID